MAAERRQQIVWGLYECLTQSDFGQVTIKDIADKADVAPGIVHHYFTNKDEIYGALSLSLRDQYETSLDEFLARQPTGTNRRNAALDFIVDEFILDRSLNRVFYNLVLKALDNTAIRQPLQDLLDRYRNRLQEEFHHLPGAAMTGQIEGLALQHLIDPDRFTREDFLAILAGFFQPDNALPPQSTLKTNKELP